MLSVDISHKVYQIVVVGSAGNLCGNSINTDGLN